MAFTAVLEVEYDSPSPIHHQYKCLMQALRRAGHCRRIRLAPALSVAELALTELDALEAAGKWQVGALE